MKFEKYICTASLYIAAANKCQVVLANRIQGCRQFYEVHLMIHKHLSNLWHILIFIHILFCLCVQVYLWLLKWLSLINTQDITLCLLRSKRAQTVHSFNTKDSNYIMTAMGSITNSHFLLWKMWTTCTSYLGGPKETLKIWEWKCPLRYSYHCPPIFTGWRAGYIWSPAIQLLHLWAMTHPNQCWDRNI